jgi:CBS-domain-containing membrane protein
MDLLARDIMNETVIACLPDTRLEDAVRTLAEHEISGMPVVDTARRVVGIVSENDLLLADHLEPPRMKTALFGFYILRQSVMDRMAELRGLRVEDVMTTRVVSFGPDTPVDEIARTLHDKKINRVPIVDADGKLMGILSRADIIRALAERL